MSTTINVPVLTPGSSYDGGSVISVPSASGGRRFGVGAIKRGDEARQVSGGPMVPGPWAYAYGLSVCIDNYGGTARESKDMRDSGQEVVVDIGDIVEIDGVVYQVSFSHMGRYADRHNIELVEVEGQIEERFAAAVMRAVADEREREAAIRAAGKEQT